MESQSEAQQEQIVTPSDLYTLMATRVSQAYGIPMDVIEDGKRRKDGSQPARALIALYMREAKCSLESIGACLGRNHSSVLRMIRGKDKSHVEAVLSTRYRSELAERERLELSRQLKEELARTCSEFVTTVEARARAAASGVEIPETTPEQEAVLPSWAKAEAKQTAAQEEEELRKLPRDRRVYEVAVRAIKKKPLEVRKPLWEAACKAMFPYSWEKQAATPPRGVQLE